MPCKPLSKNSDLAHPHVRIMLEGESSGMDVPPPTGSPYEWAMKAVPTKAQAWTMLLETQKKKRKLTQ